MFAQPVNNHSLYETKESGRGVTAVAVLMGLLLGALFNWFWAGLPFLAMVAMWPLGVAIGLIVVALASRWLRGEARWELALAGQGIGVLAIALIFIASLL
ncbi:MAG: hypothetical protein H6659_07890 [Ardenticatenaceae bacterium]|nr:hypothetical protein [Ardenticatenaceae bacterium]MCB8987416.1 hypothetical protein [Ardenticatenaceae bacterium]